MDGQGWKYIYSTFDVDGFNIQKENCLSYKRSLKILPKKISKGHIPTYHLSKLVKIQ